MIFYNKIVVVDIDRSEKEKRISVLNILRINYLSNSAHLFYLILFFIKIYLIKNKKDNNLT
jgi:hypothetical protein